MIFWEHNYNKVFWFKMDKFGNPLLVRPDGSTRSFPTDKYIPDGMKLSKQGLAGYKRSVLFQEEYEIWDGTAFGASMSGILAFGPWKKDSKGRPKALLFSTCQNAENRVYPYLGRSKINQCRKNVEEFYDDPNLQAAWNDLILYPVCFYVTKGLKTITPISIPEIGKGQSVLEGISYHGLSQISEFEEYPYIFND